jgi:hypothetical protein
METNTLITTPRAPDTTGSVSSTITIVQRDIYPTKHLQEYTTSSWLDGISTAGGFWTFVNGAFALFFGADILYFALSYEQCLLPGIHMLTRMPQENALSQRWG